MIDLALSHSSGGGKGGWAPNINLECSFENHAQFFSSNIHIITFAFDGPKYAGSDAVDRALATPAEGKHMDLTSQSQTVHFSLLKLS